MAKSKYTDMDNVAPFPNKAEIKAEAGAWLARIDRGELSPAEVRELKTWLGRSDFHCEYLLKLAANWDAMGVLGELAELFPLPETEPQRSPAPSPLAKLLTRLKAGLRLPTPAWATAAGVLLMVFVFTQSSLFGLAQQRDYVTAVGQQARYTLTDGTIIALNTNSKLKVDYTDTRRVVTLVRGEANFEVAKHPERPFVVYAGGGMVWAVGTTFNVRYTAGAVDVIVTEGTVKVFSDLEAEAAKPALTVDVAPTKAGSQEAAPTTARASAPSVANKDKKKEALLDAGQSIRYRQTIETLKPIVAEDLTRKLAWQQGALVFKGETLEQALAEIARYTDKELVIADPSVGNLRIGGHYKTDDIDALLTTLSQGLNINVEHISKDRILLSAR